MTHLDTSAGIALTEDFEPDRVIAAIPDDYLRKGILFPRHVLALGDEFAALPLEQPPPRGRYSPLEGYLARDYFRIFNAVAERSFPGIPRAQQWRLLARREIEALTDTSLGRVERSALESPRDALLRYQQFSPFVITKPRGTAMPLTKSGVRIEYTDPVVSIPYGLGVFEGIVLSYGMHPRISIEHLDRDSGANTIFDVRWGL